MNLTSKTKLPLKHLLVVDDDDVLRGALVSSLMQENYKVTSAAHAGAAQEILGIQTVDAVISDINIPVILMGGLDKLPEAVNYVALGACGFGPRKPRPR